MNDKNQIEQLLQQQALLYKEHECMVTAEMEKRMENFMKDCDYRAHSQQETFTLFNLQTGSYVSQHIASDENGHSIVNNFQTLQAGNYLIDYTHPEDKLFTLKLEIAAMKCLQLLNPNQIKNFCFTYQRRLRNDKGEYNCYIHQMRVAISDKNHCPWILQIMTKPCILNPAESVERYRIFSIKSSNEFNVFKKIWKVSIVKLTNCQKKILYWSEKGLNKQEISIVMICSLSTIRSHCDKIRSLLCVNSISLACILGTQLGLR
ncbi:MAG: helix-turn-helix transcriptional regulator [Paludibacter sp.]